MPLMPVAINTPVTGPYCLPLVSGLACSMDKAGHFTEECVDIFGNVVWDATRLKIQAKADEWRRQGFFGPTMAEKAELSYTGIEETRQKLTEEFITRSHVSAPGGQTEV
jgi:fructose 1,6-bisphosphate aldolase/phosphatase